MTVSKRTQNVGGLDLRGLLLTVGRGEEKGRMEGEEKGEEGRGRERKEEGHASKY